MNTKYIWLLLTLIGFTACNDIEDVSREEVQVLPELTTGSVDFSSYVAVGASFTAGFTDSALFIASQENSFPNILSQQFAKVGSGDFTQPLMNDNLGGIALGGVQLAGSTVAPRLVFGGAGPVPLATALGRPVLSTTDLAVNNLTGPFNNMGVPGAKSYHLLFDGYGNIANLATKTANPYFVRMASSATATVLGDAMAKKPTFFTLSEIGGNDVLGYALSGGDGTDVITPSTGAVGVGFDATFSYLVTTLTSSGAKGVVTNVPYITDLPHFTTVPYNPIPLDAATAAYLNSVAAYGAYNAGLVQAFAYLVSVGAKTQTEADAEIAKRTISFSASTNNAVVIMDESLTDLTSINPALESMRQATSADLFVLSASSFIGTLAVPGNAQTVNGVAVPLEDKWVLIPSEQATIKAATDAYNTTIASVATSNPNIALVDLNSILQELASTGISFDSFTMNAKLVTGGAISLDGIHLTARGYAYMANKFLEAIDAKFGSNFVESGNVAKAKDYPTNYSPTL
ncbi:GDSL-like lipase/acylhydrolase family protein [Mariniflexile fucanivorans]|uniref:GDSL-like lipase/acylhydrolase family protein n=1 Tax=Mariniflexile fucanivorans TaxID=264023 RepID=A0A4R1RR78_9FLAO|nr:G-D-S-L family lipolytic protein [Mariniflexile fucanivorans]TCL68933.1 GDSL-like lipase/acylhydrolase family protein [Mariniflexile fucanivorans]